MEIHLFRKRVHVVGTCLIALQSFVWRKSTEKIMMPDASQIKKEIYVICIWYIKNACFFSRPSETFNRSLHMYPTTNPNTLSFVILFLAKGLFLLIASSFLVLHQQPISPDVSTIRNGQDKAGHSNATTK